MLGSGDPTPHDAALLVALVVIAIGLLAGALTNGSWPPLAAAITRRSAVVVALTAVTVVFVRTQGGGSIVAAGRIVTIGPAIAAVLVAYLVWSWRAGRL